MARLRRSGMPARTASVDEPARRARLRRAARALGLVLAALALLWIGWRFASGHGLDALRALALTPGRIAATVAVGAVAYVPALALLALAWWRLLAALSTDSPPPWRPTFATYAISQYGKYLPGNVAHYALRHAWGRRHATPHAVLGLAAVLEAGLLLLVAVALTLAAGAQGAQAALSSTRSLIAAAALVLALGALPLVLRLLRRRGGFGRFELPALRAKALLSPMLCYAGFFAIGAAVLVAFGRVLGFGSLSYALLLAAGAASWAAGFVVVGAPAGIGVREAAFVALAGAALGDSRALLLIGLYRIVTFVGDTLFFAIGAALLRFGGGGDAASTGAANR